LEFLYHQLKILKSDLVDKIEQAKEDIMIRFQNENATLKNELQLVKDELESKSDEITSLHKEISNLKLDKVDKPDHDDLERDIAELQQYFRRNNIEICGIPDEVVNLEDAVIKIANAVDINISKNDTDYTRRRINKDPRRRINKDLRRPS